MITVCELCGDLCECKSSLIKDNGEHCIICKDCFDKHENAFKKVKE